MAATGRLPDAMEFRAAMEWGLGPMMLARSGPRLPARLTRIVARAESARHMADLNALDSAFHTALVAACGNRLAALFAGLYASLFHGQVEDPDCPRTSADRDRWMIQHGEFVKALANKDGPQFFNHLRKHTHSYMRGKAPAHRSSGGAS